MTLNLNCNGRLLLSEKPVVMGILNATPDSFYTRGKDNTPEGHLFKAEQMLKEGALILDTGGMSSRPGAAFITAEEELERVIPVITSIKKHFPEAFISVDTYRTVVAEEAVSAGADMVNDISAGSMEEGMIPAVAALNVPYILMHMQGRPATMQQNPVYENVVTEVLDYCLEKLRTCWAAGIKDIILDPGFGFGKTVEHNYQLLKGLHTFQLAGVPVLAGISRKSMICRLLDVSPENALNGTTALHMLALQQGAALLRVHDVKEAMECIRIYSFYQTI